MDRPGPCTGPADSCSRQARVTALPDAGLRRMQAVRLGRPTRTRDSVVALTDALRSSCPPPAGGG